jgi:hypothetical protein
MIRTELYTARECCKQHPIQRHGHARFLMCQATLLEAHELMAAALPGFLEKMGLYLESAMTKAILFKPVRIKVLTPPRTGTVAGC